MRHYGTNSQNMGQNGTIFQNFKNMGQYGNMGHSDMPTLGKSKSGDFLATLSPRGPPWLGQRGQKILKILVPSCSENASKIKIYR